MTAGSASSSDSRSAYLAAVILQYLELPDTPLCANFADQRQARILFDRGVPLPLVESALLLASLRRLVRPVDLPPLQPIRSLAYFLPVIDELLAQPLPDGYTDYLRLKLTRLTQAVASAKVQKTSFLDDR